MMRNHSRQQYGGWLWLALGAFVAGILAYSGWAYWQVRQGEAMSPRDSTQANIVAKKVSYYCPMHPHVQSDKNGQKCHICGMNLIPIPDSFSGQIGTPKTDETNQRQEAAHGHEVGRMDSAVPVGVQERGVIFLPEERRRMIGIVEAEVTERPLFKSIRAPGRVAFDPELYTVRSEYIEALRQWEKVRNSPLEEVRRSTEEMVRSSRIRLKVLGLSEKQIREIGPRSRNSESLLMGETGQDSWIYAEVFEGDLDLLKTGYAVEVTAPFLAGKVLAGKVVSVDNLINTDSRSARVRVQLLRRDVSLRPEAFVTVHILCPMGQHLSVPREAVLDSGRESFVFRAQGEGHYAPLPVKVLFWADQYAAISGAIKAGDRVVRKGNFMLDSEARLMGVLQSNGVE